MEDDDKKLMVIEEPVIPGVLGRVLPSMVVIGAMVGFVALAWYAYHAGSQSTREDDLLVVEADKTPIKEKPTDPGGMQFPDQDKTIFETFSSNAQPPKVERVLPTPEEPLPAAPDASETTTWVNDKLQPKKSEQVIGAQPAADAAPPVDAEVIKIPAETAPADKPAEEPKIAANTEVAAAVPVSPITEEKPAADNSQMETYVAPPAAQPDAPVVAAVPPAPVVAPPVEKKPAPVKPEQKTGAFKVQLGAYASEKEAMGAWAKIQKKHPELAGLQPSVVEADLEKGIYYRLRAVGFDSAQDAKAMCATLSASGQACLVPTDK